MTLRGWLVGGLVAAVLLAPAASFAQSDVTPPLPNVLILLDTSGSMDRRLPVPRCSRPGRQCLQQRPIKRPSIVTA